MAEFSLECEALSLSPKYYPEKWAWHPKWVGRFKVSTWGRVISCHKQVIVEGYPDNTFSAGVLLALQNDGRGYKQFNTLRQGTKRSVRIAVHQAVLEAFGKTRPSKDHVVRHVVVPDPGCNFLWNLEWGTQADNIMDKARHRSPQSALTESDVRGIWDCLLQHKSIAQVAKRFGVSGETIAAIRRRKTWRSLTDTLEPLPFKKRGRLSWSQVEEIRRRLDAGEGQRALASEFKISAAAINHIHRGRCWQEPS